MTAADGIRSDRGRSAGGPADGGRAEGIRVAAIDCGTNSLRLLVADVDPVAGRLTDVDRRMEIVRLGQGVDATGRLAPAALDRTLRALASYADIIRDRSADAVRMVATSATRDAANSADFVRGVTAVLGVAPEVLTGDEEARLSFTGATAEFGGSGAAGQAAGLGPPYLVVDIGGGSTEFVLGGGQGGAQRQAVGGPVAVGRPASGPAAAGPPTAGTALPGPPTGGTALAGPPTGGTAFAGPVSALSVDIGCVRLTERHLRSDPPTAAEITAAAADIDTALDRVAETLPVRAARTLVGLAGSVTTVAALALGLTHYDAARIHHARISARQVAEQAPSLLAQTRERRASLAVMHPGRVDVIGGGAMILDQVMRRFGFAEVLVSEHDILDGIAWWLADGGRR
jgi:exopolyphosphatase / guanosine-5'-triphosphate,3'-diphosphate pyrophosphatase